MKLYFAPGACSLAPHIALNEGEFRYSAERVDLKTHKTAEGDDYLQINPKGYVPALVLDEGEVLTEVPVLLQYLAAQSPKTPLAPPAGSLAYYRCLEWLAFTATELHQSFGPLFSPTASEAAKARQTAKIGRRFDYVANQLKNRPYLLEHAFSIADIYLFTIVNWSGFIKLDLGPWPDLIQFMGRIADRPKVVMTLKAEGLLP